MSDDTFALIGVCVVGTLIGTAAVAAVFVLAGAVMWAAHQFGIA